MTRGLAAMMVIAASACDRRAPVASCDDSLHGVWITPRGERWMMLDSGATLEGYPLFDDAVPDGAPRVIDLARGDKLAGEVKRRYMRRADACLARAPIRVTACGDDQLELVLADPPVPLRLSPCAWSMTAASRVERWRRD
jgi:hypothetical protein